MIDKMERSMKDSANTLMDAMPKAKGKGKIDKIKGSLKILAKI